jgi:PAS domain-containing protein
MRESARVETRTSLRSSLPAPLRDALSQAVMEIGADGLVESWNASAESMFGRRPEDVIGLPLAGLRVLSQEPQDRSAIADGGSRTP